MKSLKIQLYKVTMEIFACLILRRARATNDCESAAETTLQHSGKADEPWDN